jgi:hypothetical protein
MFSQEVFFNICRSFAALGCFVGSFLFFRNYYLVFIGKTNDSDDYAYEGKLISVHLFDILFGIVLILFGLMAIPGLFVFHR